MWEFKEYLEFPVNIKKKDLRFAKILINAVGGYGGEVNACLRYFMQVPTMPDDLGKRLLTEIATEEMAHIEILVKMLDQLTKGATAKDYKELGIEDKFAQNKNGVYPTDAMGYHYTVDYFTSTGDFMADLVEDMAAEEKARASYESLMDLTDDPDILAPLSFLRQREVVHYQRFAEALKHYQDIYNKE